MAPRGLSKQFVAFLVAGGIAAACNVGSRMLFSRVSSYEVAIVLAYAVGMVVAFVIMRAFVFQPSEGSKGGELLRFTIVNLLGVAQTLLVSVAVARWVAPAIGLAKHAETAGHLVGVGVPVFTSFVGHKYFSFRKRTA